MPGVTTLITLTLLGAGADVVGQALNEARRLGKQGKIPEAVAKAEEAVKLADAGSLQAAEAAYLAAGFEIARKGYPAAAEHLQRAGHWAGPDAKLRARVLARRGWVADKRGHDKTKSFIDKLKQADRDVRTYLRYPKQGKTGLPKGAKALVSARSLYAIDGDDHRAEHALAVLSRLQLASGDASALPTARNLAAASQPLDIRQLALEALWYHALAEKDVQAEVRAALALNALQVGPDVPPDERRFARGKVLDAACKKLDREEGDGACARLAKKETGEFNFFDPSVRWVPNLTPATIHAAQGQYSAALEGCIGEAIQRDPDNPLFQGERMQVEWEINGSGRTGEVTLSPRRYEGVLGACMRERVAWFRYPRPRDGGSMMVTVPFTMSTSKRERTVRLR